MRNNLLKLIGGFLIGILPIGYLFFKFSLPSEEVVETTGATIPFVPLILIIVLSLVVIVFLHSQVMNTLAKHPFSSIALLFYGGIGIVAAFFVMLLLSSIEAGVKESVEDFLTNMQIYIQATYHILFMQLAGASILGLNLFMDLRKSLK